MAAVFPLVKYGFKQRLDTAYNASVMCLAFLFFFLFSLCVCVCVLRSAFCGCLVGPVHCSWDPQTSFFFNKTFIKNGSHSTIHTFKNYFATVFSVFSKISDIQTDPLYTLQSNIVSTKKKKKEHNSYRYELLNMRRYSSLTFSLSCGSFYCTFSSRRCPCLFSFKLNSLIFFFFPFQLTGCTLSFAC